MFIHFVVSIQSFFSLLSYILHMSFSNASASLMPNFTRKTFDYSCTISLLKDLAKFQSITNIRTHVFWTFISENWRPPLIFLVPVLVQKWNQWRHTLKNTTRVEIITITIGTAILIKNNENFALIFVQFSALIVIITSTRVVFLRVWRHWLIFQPRLERGN